ncbi:MAG: hypothetical protein IZT59_04115 [Verrucomicrobia bacterium]|nr:hypothetical protein [Verrucomicrobiota bacterium]|tara:strand:+ start:27712 stop:28446 length:735 start_codon:yes stop_codon:yes gene_type:complete
MSQILEKLAILLIATVLPSCLDSEEEIWINADSSGAGRISITVPSAATTLHGGQAGIKKIAEDFLKSTPAFSSYLVETKTENKRTTLNAAFTFDNALDFLDSSFAENLDSLPGSGSEFAGTTKVAFQGLNIAFSRRTELSKAIRGAIFFPQSQLTGHEVKTTFHLPKAATSHNATSTADGGRTLIWITPLATAIRKPVETNFTMPLPIPWLTIGVTTLMVILLLAALAYYLIRRRKSRDIPVPA